MLASIVIGLRLSLLLGTFAVRVLGLFFTLAPPILSVPVGTLAAFVAVVAATAAFARGAALVAVRRVAAPSLLREP